MFRTLRSRPRRAFVAATAVALLASATGYTALAASDTESRTARSAVTSLDAPPAAGGVGIATFAGVVTAIQGNSVKYVFAGPTTSVTIQAGDRLTGAASAPLGLTSGTQTADVGLCYQQGGAGSIINFVGANFAAHFFSSTRETYAASSSVVPPEGGTYTVGLCIRNNGNTPINNNNFVNGWVMVSAG